MAYVPLAAPLVASGLGELGLSAGSSAALAPVLSSFGGKAASKAFSGLVKPLANRLFSSKTKKSARSLFRKAKKITKAGARIASNPAVHELAALGAGAAFGDKGVAAVHRGGEVLKTTADTVSDLHRLGNALNKGEGVEDFHDTLNRLNARASHLQSGLFG